MAVQGMRIDFKIDLPNDVNPRRLRPINKFKTAITPEHPLPSLSDPEFDLELVIQASKAVHVSLEDVQSGEGKWVCWQEPFLVLVSQISHAACSCGRCSRMS